MIDTPFMMDFSVRYNETDKMGRVYYANYFIWFEMARTNVLKTCGNSYKDLEEKGIFLPVSRSYAHYLNPSFYDDRLTIETRVEYIKKYSIKFVYKITNKDNATICKGYTVHACIDSTGTLTPLPETIFKAGKNEEF